MYRAYKYIEDPVLGFGVLAACGLFFIVNIVGSIISNYILSSVISNYISVSYNLFIAIFAVIYFGGLLLCYRYISSGQIARLKKFKTGFSIGTIVLIIYALVSIIFF